MTVIRLYCPVHAAILVGTLAPTGQAQAARRRAEGS